MVGDSAKNPIQTTKNSFQLIELLSESGGLTLPELSSRVDLSKGAIYNHLATLQDLGVVVEQDDTYYPSVRTYQLGETARKALPAADFARKRLWNLADSTGEFGALIVEENGVPVVVDIAAGSVNNLWVTPGEELSLYQTAAGKILLAQKSEQRIRALCDQSNEMIDTNKIVENIKTVKAQGLAFSRGEIREDQYSVAAPILNRDDDLVYVTTLIGPKERLSGKSLQQDVAGLVVNTATEIERNLYL